MVGGGEDSVWDEWDWLDRDRSTAVRVGRRRLYGPSSTRATTGAYVPAGADLARRCRAVLSQLPPSTAVSHWTALGLFRLPVPRYRSVLPVHVTTVGADDPRATRRKDLRGHTSDSPLPVCLVDGVRCTALVRTWCDLARAGATVEELVVVGDALLARSPGSAAALTVAVAGGRARRGIRTARVAVGLLDGRAESPPESVLRVVLRSADLPAPVPQLVVRDAVGRFVARVDLGWEAEKVAVEYDGRHHMEAGQWQLDIRRRERLEELGWRVVVVTHEDLVRDPAGTVARVRRALRR